MEDHGYSRERAVSALLSVIASSADSWNDDNDHSVALRVSQTHGVSVVQAQQALIVTRAVQTIGLPKLIEIIRQVIEQPPLPVSQSQAHNTEPSSIPLIIQTQSKSQSQPSTTKPTTASVKKGIPSTIGIRIKSSSSKKSNNLATTTTNASTPMQQQQQQRIRSDSTDEAIVTKLDTKNNNSSANHRHPSTNTTATSTSTTTRVKRTRTESSSSTNNSTLLSNTETSGSNNNNNNTLNNNHATVTTNTANKRPRRSVA
jgi:hypothetical protein